MIDSVLNLAPILLCQLLILLVAVISLLGVTPWVATEDKFPNHMTGSTKLELSLEDNMEIQKLAIHTLCHNVNITLKALKKAAQIYHK